MAGVAACVRNFPTLNYLCKCGFHRLPSLKHCARSYSKSTLNSSYRILNPRYTKKPFQVANYYVKSKPKDPHALSWKAIIALCGGISCGIGFSLAYLGT